MTGYEVINTYNPFIGRVFNYLKQNILVNFPQIRIEISYDTKYSTGTGNTVSARNLFYKIVLYIYAFDNHIDNIVYTKNRMLWVLIHESYHQNQMYDINKYNSDKDYRDYIECNVDYAAISYINEHELELSSILGIPIYTYDINKIRKIHNSPKLTMKVTQDNLDVKTFVSLISYYFTMDINILYNLYHSKDNIIINYHKGDYIEPISLKSNGHMDYKNVNYIMTKYMSQGILNIMYNSSINNLHEDLVINIYLKNELMKVYGVV